MLSGSLIKSESITTEEWEENNSEDYSEYHQNPCKSGKLLKKVFCLKYIYM